MKRDYILSISLALGILIFNGCTNSGTTTTSSASSTSQVTSPQFNPAAGLYDTTQNIAITCSTNNTVIFYTTDGSDPDVNGQLYTAPVSVSADATIRAIAYDYKSNAQQSNEVQAVYRFIPGAPVITVSATAADYNKATVTWNSVPNAASYNVYYAEGTTVNVSTGTKITNATSSHTISGLQTDKYYSFIVTGVNTNGEGTASVVNSAKIAGHWENLDSTGFSDDASLTEIAVAPDGTPYVVYRDSANSDKATVKKYNTSTGWVTVGNAGFSAGTNIISPCIAIDSNNVPYVAYINPSSSYVSVMKYNSVTFLWEPVGSDINGIARVVYPEIISLAITPGNTPYIAFADRSVSDKATVMKFNGSAWEAVGTEGFSDYSALYISIAISNDGTPYVAYNDFETIWNYRVTVKKYVSSAWTDVQSFGTPVIVKIMTDSAGVPYVGYVPGGLSAGNTLPKMQKYKTLGGFTRFFGLPTLTSGNDDPNVYSSTLSAYSNYSIALDANDTAYAAFDRGKAMVRRFNAVSNAWETVGLEDFSAANVETISIAIDKNTNTPYVAFRDLTSGKGIVMVYR